ncbi:MAG TPA: hypothetical protein VNA22_04860 [Pyrinomonadaceae bacterium]|nr:hypothetical protein [Pyrinomonadaceae bacterium]
MTEFLKNKKPYAAVFSLVCVLGCGLFGENKIENVVINSDLDKQQLNITEGVSRTWDFSRDQSRCFQVTDGKYTGDTAQLTLTVASYYESEAVGGSVFTVFGKVLMHYKRDGNTWKLEKAESKELIQKILEGAEFTKFLDIAAPVCQGYRAPLSK